MSVSSEIICTFLFGMEFAKTSAFKRKDAIMNESNNTIIEIQFLGIEPYSVSYRLAKQMACDRSSLMKWRPLSEYTVCWNCRTLLPSAVRERLPYYARYAEMRYSQTEQTAKRIYLKVHMSIGMNMKKKEQE